MPCLDLPCHTKARKGSCETKRIKGKRKAKICHGQQKPDCWRLRGRGSVAERNRSFSTCSSQSCMMSIPGCRLRFLSLFLASCCCRCCCRECDCCLFHSTWRASVSPRLARPVGYLPTLPTLTTLPNGFPFPPRFAPAVGDGSPHARLVLVPILMEWTRRCRVGFVFGIFFSLRFALPRLTSPGPNGFDPFRTSDRAHGC